MKERMYFIRPKPEHLLNYSPGVVLEVLKDKNIRTGLFGNAFHFSLWEEKIPKLVIDQKTAICINLSPYIKMPIHGECLYVWPVKRHRDVFLTVILEKCVKKDSVIGQLHGLGYIPISPKEALALLLEGISSNASQLAKKAEEYGKKAITLYVKGERDAKKYGHLCIEFIHRVLATVDYVTALLIKAKLVDQKLTDLNNEIRRRVLRLKEKISRYIVE